MNPSSAGVCGSTVDSGERRAGMFPCGNRNARPWSRYR